MATVLFQTTPRIHSHPLKCLSRMECFLYELLTSTAKRKPLINILNEVGVSKFGHIVAEKFAQIAHESVFACVRALV